MNEIKLFECKKHGLTEFSLCKDGRFRCKKCSSESVTERRRRLKYKLLEYKGGKCEICGYDKCYRALEFHHLNPEEKEFKIASTNKSFETLKKEVDKCILVCSNCHMEIHDRIETEKRLSYTETIEQNKNKYNHNGFSKRCKRSELDIEEIKCDIDKGLKQPEIAEKYNISVCTLKRFISFYGINMKKLNN